MLPGEIAVSGKIIPEAEIPALPAEKIHLPQGEEAVGNRKRNISIIRCTMK